MNISVLAVIVLSSLALASAAAVPSFTNCEYDGHAPTFVVHSVDAHPFPGVSGQNITVTFSGKLTQTLPHSSEQIMFASNCNTFTVIETYVNICDVLPCGSEGGEMAKFNVSLPLPLDQPCDWTKFELNGPSGWDHSQDRRVVCSYIDSK